MATEEELLDEIRSALAPMYEGEFLGHFILIATSTNAEGQPVIDYFADTDLPYQALGMLYYTLDRLRAQFAKAEDTDDE